MSYATKLKYAGAEPFEPEQERDDISHDEYELLTQDETYQRLAEVRWLADDLEAELAGQDFAPEAYHALFGAIGVRAASLQAVVEASVYGLSPEFLES